MEFVILHWCVLEQFSMNQKIRPESPKKKIKKLYKKNTKSNGKRF